MTDGPGIGQLAQFGGRPLFETIRMTGQLDVPDPQRFRESVRNIFAARRITNDGPCVRELESRLADYHGVGNVVAMTNACFAIMLALRAFGDGGRRRVIMPSFSYRGLPHLARWAGLEPCYVDVEAEFHTIDPARLDAAMPDDAAAILAVHNPNGLCDVDRLENIARRHGVPLMFDSVYGMGARWNGELIGRFGDCEVFSLHATKLINGFEGGYLTTDDDGLAELLRRQRNFGIEDDGSISSLGLNAKLNELHAAMALLSLEQIDAILERNRQRCDAYRRVLEDVPGLSLAPYQEHSNRGLVLVEVDESFPLTRKQLITLLRAENALVRPYYDPPLHVQDRQGAVAGQGLPVTDSLRHRFVQMPVGAFVSLDDIERLGAYLRRLFELGPQLRARLDNEESAR